MTRTMAAEFAERRFRAGSEFALTVYDRLSESERALLADLRKDQSFYGILRPRAGSSRTLKAVDKNTALLWLTLQVPGSLPFFALEEEPERTLASISALVLDGILEVESDGRFVSGGAAAVLLRDSAAPSAGSVLATLSLEALRYGEALGLQNADALAARLYSYGSVPLTSRWERLFPDAPAVRNFLGIETYPGLAAELRHRWREDHPGNGSAWIAYSRLNTQQPSANEAVYKLYVSPQPSHLPEVFRTAASLFAELGGTRFKVGANAAGILRPDKLVFYFDRLEDLEQVASRLAPAVRGIPAQGVPFSAAVSEDSLLSWGMDPAASEQILSWQERESWRLWVVRRLAAALIAAQSDDRGPLRPWEFALERLRHEGVDPEEWSPPPSFRRAAGSVVA